MKQRQFTIGDHVFVENDKLQSEGFFPNGFHFTSYWSSFHLLHQPFSLYYGYDFLRNFVGQSLEEVK